MRIARTSTDPAAQLVQLCEAQALGILDDHQARIGHIHADLDHRGRHQKLRVACSECSHDCLLVGRFHAPVNQSHGEPFERPIQLGVHAFGRLRLQLLGLLDQCANPVGLTTLGAGAAYTGDHLLPAAVPDEHGGHRRASRRSLVDHRHVKIGIGGHCQRARYRCRGHHQLVRHLLSALTLIAQRQALMHAEAVLFVDDHQPQFAERHLILHQRVRADTQRRTLDHRRQRLAPGLALDLAGQPYRLNAKRPEPAAKGLQMLLGEQFSGRHQRHLVPGLDGLQRSQRCDHGLA